MNLEIKTNRLVPLIGAFISMAAISHGADDKASDLKPLYDLAGDKSFKEYAGNPVLKPGAPGEFDAGALGTMTVVKVNGVYHMYFEVWGRLRDHTLEEYETLQIGHATSQDGVHWTKDPANPVIPHGGPNDFDNYGAWDPFVLYEDGKFKMWYGGGVPTGPGIHFKCPWGYAESMDGYHWVKKGEISPNDNIPDVEDDRVIHDKKTGHYFMYYMNHLTGNSIFRAESPDEMHFDYTHAIPIQIDGLPWGKVFKYPQTFQVGDSWYMLFGVSSGDNGNDSTGIASSSDGVHWTSRVPRLLPRAHDSALLKVADDLYVIYYGPNKLQDQAACDIRLAVFKGTLEDMLVPAK